MRGSKKPKPETPRQRNTKERLERGEIILSLADKVKDLPHKEAEKRVLMWELTDIEMSDLDLKIEAVRDQLKEDK